MTDFTKCPQGHQLPHVTQFGNCTPLKCAATSTKISVASRAKRGDAIATAVKEAADEREEDKQQAIAKRGHEKWLKFLGIPENLSGDEAEKFADAKLASLLPVAVGVLEDQVKFGSRSEKTAAAKQILESNGRGKRDAVAASSPPIVINVSGAGVSLPWRQEKEVKGEAQVVDAPAKDTKS